VHLESVGTQPSLRDVHDAGIVEDDVDVGLGVAINLLGAFGDGCEGGNIE
jgi:hypothetical protein